MISIPLAAAIGATALAVAPAATGDITGLGVALGHLPLAAHGFDAITAVSNAPSRGVAGGGIGAAIAAAAKSLVPG